MIKMKRREESRELVLDRTITVWGEGRVDPTIQLILIKLYPKPVSFVISPA
jgi:hypothetical protein